MRRCAHLLVAGVGVFYGEWFLMMFLFKVGAWEERWVLVGLVWFGFRAEDDALRVLFDTYCGFWFRV